MALTQLTSHADVLGFWLKDSRPITKQLSGSYNQGSPVEWDHFEEIFKSEEEMNGVKWTRERDIMKAMGDARRVRLSRFVLYDRC